MASIPEIQWELLAHAMPVQTFSAAANSVPALGVFGAERNFNMQVARKKNGDNTVWPEERVQDDELGIDWLHSDFKNMALPYVYIMYWAMIDPQKVANPEELLSE